MYSKVEEYKKTLKSDEQQYDTYIILEDGTKVDKDISSFKPIYKLGEKIIGNFATKRVEFTLFNTSKYNITNQEFEVFVGLKINKEFSYISLGKFIANKPEIKDETLDECLIVAQNYSLKFKIPYKPILTFPCTIKEAIRAICNHLNISYIDNDFINANYVLEELFIDEDANFFDVIKVLVEAGFANADMSNTNSLIVKSPKKIVDYKFELNELFDLKKEDNKFGPLNAIVSSRIVADDGSTTEDVFARDEKSITKNGLYEYKILQNDAIDYDRQTAVNNILKEILDFEYVPAKIEAVYNPCIEVGDMLEVPDKKTDTSFLLFAKEITADLATGLMTIESTEKTRTETDYKSATNKEKKKKTELKVNKMEGKITSIIELQEEHQQQITKQEMEIGSINSSVKMLGGNNKQQNSVGAFGVNKYEGGTLLSNKDYNLQVARDDILYTATLDVIGGKELILYGDDSIRVKIAQYDKDETDISDITYGDTYEFGSTNTHRIKLKNETVKIDVTLTVLHANANGEFSIDAFNLSYIDKTIKALETQELKETTESGRAIQISNYTWFKLRSEDLIKENTYTLSFKYKNSAYNNLIIKLLNNNEVILVNENTIIDQTDVGKFKNVEYTFVANTSNVELYVETHEGEVEIADYYLQTGDVRTIWQPR